MQNPPVLEIGKRMAAAAIFNPWTLHLKDAVIGRGQGFQKQVPALQMKNGDICYIEGENGAGKTTLLQSVVGLLPFLQGGQTITEKMQSPAFFLWRGAAPALWLNLRVRDMLLLQQEMCRSDMRIESVCTQVGLDAVDTQKCGYLSTGQQARLHLAALFFSMHPLWVLDEPFRGLDTEGVILFSQQIIQHAQQGGGVLFTSHQAVEIAPTQQMRLP